MPSSPPAGPQGSSSPTLHVADGSEILYGSVSGPHVVVLVGRGNERYGSCVTRLTQATLAGGYLPVVETAYVDAAGAHYRQESFGGRLTDGTPAAFLRITSDHGYVRVVGGPGTRAGRSLTLAWVPRARRLFRLSASDYDAALQSLSTAWDQRLATGASIVVPERRVMDAERGTLIQDLMLTWRYSAGNPYQEFSFPESIDSAQVLAELGFADAARSIMRTSLTRRPEPYANWKMGEKLLGSATYYRLSRDRAYVTAETPVLAGYVRALALQLRGPTNLLDKERYSSDIADDVYGLHSQAIVWQGLGQMAAAWAATGHRALAARTSAFAARLRRGVLQAFHRSATRLPDGSLFAPVELLGNERPYRLLPATRLGSYWNLVAPYALASGILSHREEQSVLRYLLLHGSRVAGLVRAGSFALYGHGTTATGIDQVYGLNISRFLADLDEPDQIDLSLYGQLAAGMTPRTFIAGEGASISPIDHAYYRSMYLPPNTVSNAAFLETLRSTIVHERRGGLELAFATPRAWLAPGKRIAVRSLPTSFGALSYTLVAHATSVDATVDAPNLGAHSLRLRLRLPGHRRIASVLLGGAPLTRFDPATGTIDLTGRHGVLTLEVRLAH